MTFEEVYGIVSGLQTSVASYEEDSCALLWSTASKLPHGSTILEVGCEYGRSTSLLALAARDCNGKLICIDPFVDPDSAPIFLKNMRTMGVPFSLHVMTTAQADAAHVIPQSLSFVHIDGDHKRAGIGFDCATLLRRIVSGGYLAVHDFGRESLPDVKAVVDMWTQNSEWETVGTAATCHVVRKK